MTVQQRQLLKQDLEELRAKLNDIVALVRTCYGETAEALIRAEETAAALKRLEWALERDVPPQSSPKSEEE